MRCPGVFLFQQQLTFLYFFCFTIKNLYLEEKSMPSEISWITVIVGMQYGSEGKGAIAEHLSPLTDYGIRVGGSNAGHTTYFAGTPHVVRQLPSTWVAPHCELVIGRTAVINLNVLLAEISRIEKLLPITSRLHIDAEAIIVTPEHIATEAKANLAARIASTSSKGNLGIAAARSAKLWRRPLLQAKDVATLRPFVTDTAELLDRAIPQGNTVVVEGTQGFGLSLDYGYYPYVTSIDTSVGRLLADTGIPSHVYDISVIGVVRTYPIRVGGPSGPCGDDAEELTWQELAKQAGAPKTLCEYTSVTGTPRRVFTFSERDILRAVKRNRPTELAVTFADYLDWSLHERPTLSSAAEKFIDNLERLTRVSVGLVKTGPQTIIDRDHLRTSYLRRVA